MRVKIKNQDTNFGIWIPLFIIFPILLIIFIALSPLILLTALILLPFGMARMVLCLPAIYTLFCAMKGLEVDVSKGNHETVLITVK